MFTGFSMNWLDHSNWNVRNILAGAVILGLLSFGAGLLFGGSTGEPPPADSECWSWSIANGVMTMIPPAAQETAADGGPVSQYGRLLDFRQGQRVPQTPYGSLIYQHARRRKLNPDLVAAVIGVESSFNPAAVSNKGAIGLMQVIPATAKRFGIDPKRLRDPSSNLIAGTRYLEWLNERYDGNVRLTLAAYNAGDGAVDRWGGIPPYRETRTYVKKVLSTLRELDDPTSG